MTTRREARRQLAKAAAEQAQTTTNPTHTPTPAALNAYADPYTMDARLCDNNGIISDQPVEPGSPGTTLAPQLTYRTLLNNLRRHTGLDPYTGEPFPCTGSAHLAREHIRCTSPAHTEAPAGPGSSPRAHETPAWLFQHEGHWYINHAHPATATLHGVLQADDAEGDYAGSILAAWQDALTVVLESEPNAITASPKPCWNCEGSPGYCPSCGGTGAPEPSAITGVMGAPEQPAPDTAALVDRLRNLPLDTLCEAWSADQIEMTKSSDERYGAAHDAVSTVIDEAIDALAAAEQQTAEARTWARHGYEIGQRSCLWADHGVAPAWLTEGWPLHFEADPLLEENLKLECALATAQEAAKVAADGLRDASATIGELTDENARLRADVDRPAVQRLLAHMRGEHQGDMWVEACQACMTIRIGDEADQLREQLVGERQVANAVANGLRDEIARLRALPEVGGRRG